MPYFIPIGGGPAPPSNAEFFAASSMWNAPLTGAEGVHPSSAQIIASCKTIKPDGTPFQVSAGNGYGIPIFRATPATPRYNGASADGWQIPSIPWPPGTAQATGEGYLVIIDQPTNKIYNFLQASLNGSLITFYAAGVYKFNGHGWWDPEKDQANRGPWSGASSGASYVAGCVTLAEINAGVIPHALCMTLDNNIQSQAPALPAKITDGWISADNGQWPSPGVPNGTRLRIRSNVNVSALGLGPTARIMAQAMQTYGIICVDRSGGISFRCQENASWATIWSGSNITGLTGTLFNYMEALPPIAAAEYDCPSTWIPAQPHK